MSGRRSPRRRTEYAGGSGPRYLLLGATVFLMLAGLVMIYSAASVSDYVRYGDSAHHLKRQLMWIAFGAIALIVASRFDYRRLRALAVPLWGLALGLLVLVNVLGVVRGGARRWIMLGSLGQFQPSELAKLACVILTAYLVSEWCRRRVDEPQLLQRVFLMVGVVAGLVILQPDLGTTIAIALSVALVLFLGGVSFRPLLLASGVIVLLGVAAVAIEPYRVQRFLAFRNPWEDPQGIGYQTVQAMLAFGTGGIDGIGLGLSRQKFFYLPEAHTDFILAIVGEEAGLVGTLAILCAFVVFVYAGFRIALGTRDTFGRLLAGGLTGMIGIQAVMNMAAVTGLMPVTGKPLPFVSFGGSSMLFTALCVGLILSVSSRGALAPRATRAPSTGKEMAGAVHTEWWRDSRTRVPGPVSGRGAARRRA